jgi:hypothetical protein
MARMMTHPAQSAQSDCAVGILCDGSFQTVDCLVVLSIKEQRQAVERLYEIARTFSQF